MQGIAGATCHRQVLTPWVRVEGGFLLAPPRGWGASMTTQRIGAHWLDSLNTFRAPGYAVIDGSLGYRFERLTATVLGANLGHRRDGAQLSELGEVQFDRLPACRVGLKVTWQYKTHPRAATPVRGGV